MDEIEKLKAKIDEEKAKAPPVPNGAIPEINQEGGLQDISRFINYPYSFLAENVDETFALSETEKELNSELAYLTMVYLLPKIDVGKFALIMLIVFNASMLSFKTIIVMRKKKRKRELDQEIEEQTEKLIDEIEKQKAKAFADNVPPITSQEIKGGANAVPTPEKKGQESETTQGEKGKTPKKKQASKKKKKKK